MINPSTQPRSATNAFTQHIKDNPGVWVELRNGHYVQPIFEGAEDETCLDCFAAPGHRWELDGHSVTSCDFDMMKLKEGD